MRMIIAIAVTLTLTTGAQAYCYSVPDTAQSYYLQHNMQRMICIQEELGQSVEARAQQTEINATLDKLQRDALQQRLQIQQMIAASNAGAATYP